MEREPSLPVFMGVCESALIRGDGVLQDFYGVGDLLILPFFPQNLKDILLLIGLPGTMIRGNKPISFTIQEKRNPESKGRIDLRAIVTESAGNKTRLTGISKHFQRTETEEKKREGEAQVGARLLIPPEPIYKLMPIPCPPLFIKEPGGLDVIARVDDREFLIGSFECAFCAPPPISEEERLAIMSRPGAIRGVGYKLSCKKCDDKVHFHLNLDGSSESPRDMKESILLTAAHDRWVCKCGQTDVPLSYLKQGLHDMFRRISTAGKKEVGFVPLYQKGAIAAVTGEYQKLIGESADAEEPIVKFMADNPILWNFLASNKIWKKPAISTKYSADFGILTRMKVLYFVEVEKPRTKLVKKGGGIHSELQAGLDQIRDWRIEIDKRREAILDSLGLAQKEVHDIRYILIAGMASKTSMAGLEKIRRMRTDADFIFCFDELASFLHSTETALLNI